MSALMDFLDPKKMRRHTVQLFIGYALVATAVALATTILIYYAYGFAVNRQGDLQQRGLVFVSSQPSGAQLRVNGKRVNDTNTKLNLSAGTYNFDINRDGYRTWHRNAIIEGGSVNHLVYPFLIPKQLQTTDVKTYNVKPAITTQSPDRRFLLVMTDAVGGIFDVIDLNKDQETVSETTQATIPESLLTPSATTPTWQVMEWSSNNRHVLLKRTYTVNAASAFEYILFDRQRPEGSRNLSIELTGAPSLITLRNKKPDSYYVYDSAKLQLKTASLDELTPKVILNNVLSYKSHGDDTLLYVSQDTNDENDIRARLLQDDKTTLLRKLDKSDNYVLDIARYESHWYVVIGANAESRVYVYKDPSDTKVRKNIGAQSFYALRVDRPTNVSFSANAQYILAQNSTTAHLYDIEENRGYRYALNSVIDAPQTKATWMDGNRLTYVSSGKQILFDYDHINKQTLVDASPVYETSFDQRYRYVYTFVPNEQDGLTLSATALRTPADL